MPMSRSEIDTVRRRKYLLTIGAVVGSAGLAGCSESNNVDGELVVQETVTSSQEQFEFDAEEGDSVSTYVDVRDGPGAVARLKAPLGARAATEEIENEKTFSHTVEDGGLFVLEVWLDGEVYVEVGIES